VRLSSKLLYSRRRRRGKREWRRRGENKRESQVHKAVELEGGLATIPLAMIDKNYITPDNTSHLKIIEHNNWNISS